MLLSSLSLGSVVVNFGTTAKVVGFFTSASGAPSDHDGHPILRAVGATGRLRGGKWLADPAKCSPVDAGVAAAGRAFARSRKVED